MPEEQTVPTSEPEETVPAEQLAGDPSEAPPTPDRPDADPEARVTPDDVLEVLRECYDPEIPVNIVDLGLIYDIGIQPQRVDVKMTLTALGCPMAGDVMSDDREHLLSLPGIRDAGVELTYDPPWSPERMTEDARWELGLV